MITSEPAVPTPEDNEVPKVPAGRKSWQDFSRRQKSAIIVQGALQLALTGWALWDAHHREPQRLRGSKWLWTGLALVQPIGPIAYLLFGRKR